MAKKKRDNFLESTIATLASRVAYKCSSPKCRRVTAGPSSKKNSFNKTGEAAHIYAASPNGPRANPNMTREERRSIDNAIWLCGACSDEIDKDPDSYPAEMLKSWKNEAEKLAKEELNQRLPQKNDALDTLTTALTGTASRFLPDMISNVSQATVSYLERIDPRLKVKVNYDEDLTSYIFNAKPGQEVKFNTVIEPRDPEVFQKQWQDLMKYGIPLDANVKGIDFKNLPIMEKILAEQDLTTKTIQLTPIPKDALMKIVFIKNDTDEIYVVDDMPLKVYTGEKAMNVEGILYNMINLTYKSEFPASGSINIKVSLNIDFSVWKGQNILSIPFFTKVYEFISKIYEGWELQGSLEFNGERLAKYSNSNFSKSEALCSDYRILRYIFLAREIAKAFDVELTFNTFSFTGDDMNRLENIYRAIRGNREMMSAGLENKVTLYVDLQEADTFIEMFSKTNKILLGNIQVKEDIGEIKLFNTPIQIPPLLISFTNVEAYINEKIDLSILKENNKVTIHYMATENSYFSLSIYEE
ncbi:hypothetical protein TSL6_20480 [Sulfurovum sp. TSL6]|uniref:hypothetical protein n=1 Tax=Sulfurovum sp. TSL6 TaxID=2826995 RepID=UPI001CC81987|nr:hypothetical protein [Sulfurovum sp. TSL6]GIU01542.1 hypothetical protein TSL6_20480 [Sulfurovum sp. TSL6]